ncbi:MAG: DUF6489 family protein [Janthinobacterium lividum]
MRINLEIDCTPEEARRAMGLPDLSMVHERYVAMLQEAMTGKVQPEAAETMMRSWAPMGEAGMSMWRRMVEAAASAPGRPDRD